MRAFGSDGKEIVSACYCLEAFFEVTIGKGEAMNFPPPFSANRQERARRVMGYLNYL